MGQRAVLVLVHVSVFIWHSVRRVMFMITLILLHVLLPKVANIFEREENAIVAGFECLRALIKPFMCASCISTLCTHRLDLLIGSIFLSLVCSFAVVRL